MIQVDGSLSAFYRPSRRALSTAHSGEGTDREANRRADERHADRTLRSTDEAIECGGDDPPDDQRLTLDEALRAHTFDAAVAIGMEDRIGSLQPGKFADVTIVDGDLEATAPEQIASLGMWMTILDGELVWTAAGASFTTTGSGA